MYSWKLNFLGLHAKSCERDELQTIISVPTNLNSTTGRRCYHRNSRGQHASVIVVSRHCIHTDIVKVKKRTYIPP